jgi:hypothetical protein
MLRAAPQRRHSEFYLAIRAGGQWTGHRREHAFFAYAADYPVDTDHGVVVEVEAMRAIRQAKGTRFGFQPRYAHSRRATGSAGVVVLERMDTIVLRTSLVMAKSESLSHPERKPAVLR